MIKKLFQSLKNIYQSGMELMTVDFYFVISIIRDYLFVCYYHPILFITCAQQQ